jgi:hypothetical protein
MGIPRQPRPFDLGNRNSMSIARHRLFAVMVHRTLLYPAEI